MDCVTVLREILKAAVPDAATTSHLGGREWLDEIAACFSAENSKEAPRVGRMVVTGDSAGGNLSVTSFLYLVQEAVHTKKPLHKHVSALVLFYPTVNLSLSPSPSRALCLNDVLLPHCELNIKLTDGEVWS